MKMPFAFSEHDGPHRSMRHADDATMRDHRSDRDQKGRRPPAPVDPQASDRHNDPMLGGRIKRTIRILRMAANERPGETAVVRPHVRRWIRDRWTFADPLSHDRPWIVYEAADWLDGLVRPDWTIFEWGSGVSTLFFARRAARVIAIEHLEGWRARVLDRLAREGLDNAEIRLVHGAQPANAAVPVEDHNLLDYTAYAAAIDEQPDASLDLVMVDGQARPRCIEHAVTKIRPGGWLVLDNAERDAYQPSRRMLDQYESKVFRGVANGVARYFETVAWRISPAD
jgi:predicted O-methyltransferase YrrM